MPKRSRKEDREKAMVGGSSKQKSSDTAKSSRSTKGKETVKEKGIDIPLSECSEEFKKFVVTELVKTGKAKIIKKNVKKGKKK